MPEGAEFDQVAAGPAAKIKDLVGSLSSNAGQEGVDVLGDIVVFCSLPKANSAFIIMQQCLTRYSLELTGRKFSTHFLLARHSLDIYPIQTCSTSAVDFQMTILLLRDHTERWV